MHGLEDGLPLAAVAGRHTIHGVFRGTAHEQHRAVIFCFCQNFQSPRVSTPVGVVVFFEREIHKVGLATIPEPLLEGALDGAVRPEGVRSDGHLTHHRVGIESVFVVDLLECLEDGLVREVTQVLLGVVVRGVTNDPHVPHLVAEPFHVDADGGGVSGGGGGDELAKLVLDSRVVHFFPLFVCVLTFFFCQKEQKKLGTLSFFGILSSKTMTNIDKIRKMLYITGSPFSGKYGEGYKKRRQKREERRKKAMKKLGRFGLKKLLQFLQQQDSCVSFYKKGEGGGFAMEARKDTDEGEIGKLFGEWVVQDLFVYFSIQRPEKSWVLEGWLQHSTARVCVIAITQGTFWAGISEWGPGYKEVIFEAEASADTLEEVIKAIIDEVP